MLQSMPQNKNVSHVKRSVSFAAPRRMALTLSYMPRKINPPTEIHAVRGPTPAKKLEKETLYMYCLLNFKIFHTSRSVKVKICDSYLRRPSSRQRVPKTDATLPLASTEARWNKSPTFFIPQEENFQTSHQAGPYICQHNSRFHDI